MSKKDIEKQVLSVIYDQLGSGNEIKLNTPVLNASGIDHADEIELVMRLEEELGVEIPDKDAEKLVTVEDIIKYLKTKEEKNG